MSLLGILVNIYIVDVGPRESPETEKRPEVASTGRLGRGPRKLYGSFQVPSEVQFEVCWPNQASANGQVAATLVGSW